MKDKKIKEHEYPVTEGERIQHVQVKELKGVLISINRKIKHPTTCLIQWDNTTMEDPQWTDNIVPEKEKDND